MNTFEYKVLDIAAKFSWGGTKINFQELTNELNDLGKQGWELVSTNDTSMHEGATSGLILILKRTLTH
jgi:hypothetical protein